MRLQEFTQDSSVEEEFKRILNIEYSETPEELRQFQILYVGSAKGYSINRMLRKNKISKADQRYYSKDQISDNAVNAQDLFNKLARPLSRDIFVYRGINGNVEALFRNVKIGDVIIDKGFVSTCLSYKDALMYYTAGNRGAVLRIHIPSGVKVVASATWSAMNPPEDEFIMSPGTRFKVLSIETKPLSFQKKTGFQHETNKKLSIELEVIN